LTLRGPCLWPAGSSHARGQQTGHVRGPVIVGIDSESPPAGAPVAVRGIDRPGGGEIPASGRAGRGPGNRPAQRR
jgi:hypothetical protein